MAPCHLLIRGLLGATCATRGCISPFPAGASMGAVDASGRSALESVIHGSELKVSGPSDRDHHSSRGSHTRAPFPGYVLSSLAVPAPPKQTSSLRALPKLQLFAPTFTVRHSCMPSVPLLIWYFLCSQLSLFLKEMFVIGKPVSCAIDRMQPRKCRQ